MYYREIETLTVRRRKKFQKVSLEISCHIQIFHLAFRSGFLLVGNKDITSIVKIWIEYVSVWVCICSVFY